MAEKETRLNPAPETSTSHNPAWHPAGVSPKDAGWYPIGASRTEQAFWDGGTWTERRHWTVNGWVEQGSLPERAGAGAAPPALRVSANPYAQPDPRSKAGPLTVNLGVFLLLVCGIALMYGSVGDVGAVSAGAVGIAGFRVSLNGIDPGISTLISVNGWVTFIGGIVIVIFACFEMTSDGAAAGRSSPP